MNEIKFINPKRIVFDESLTVVPMMGTIAERFQGAAKADLRAEGQSLSEELTALHGELEKFGIQEPIPVTFMVEKKKGQKKKAWVKGWDGRHRTGWALGKGLKTVPVRVVTEAEGRAHLESTVIGRRHWTKGQRAWLAVTLHPAVAGNTKGRPGKSDSVGITAADLASRFGVSPDLIDQAVKIHRVFEQLPSLREKHEPGIWVGHGLGAVLAGIPGAITTESKPKPAISWTTMQGPLSTLSNVAKSFAKWTAEERDCARDAFANWLSGLPEDFRLTLTEAVAQSAEGETAE
jgi:hypothetical protein